MHSLPIFDFEKIISLIPCSIIIINKNEQIIFCNDRISQLTGLPVERIIGRSIFDIGLEAIEKNNLISDKRWWDWTEDATIHRRAILKDNKENSIPVLISGKRSSPDSASNYLYLCIIDLSLFDNKSVEPSSCSVSRESYYGIIGRTPLMLELYDLIEKSSSTDVNVIIQGESGTGKELVAAAIHKASARRDSPLIRVNCAALSETLLESELFGHVKGAFTGAYKDRTGNFEAAQGGTIFLDEIGEISPAVQVKLLRVLQERIVVRVGDNREIPVDVRIIAATNKNLRFLVQKGVFREDLFYRLNVFPIHVPALNERKPDIPLLCNYFLKKFRDETSRSIYSISSDAMRLLMEYCWPGNVRELENAIEHAFVLCQSEEVLVTDLPHDLRVKAVREGICAQKFAGLVPPVQPVFSGPQKTNGRLSITKAQLQSELEKHGGNKSQTARALGISKVALWKKMKSMGMT